jgi:hypothetical protein
MLAVFVPAIRPEGEKNTDSYEDDLEKQMEERFSMFSAAQAHGREYRSMELGARSGGGGDGRWKMGDGKGEGDQ